MSRYILGRLCIGVYYYYFFQSMFQNLVDSAKPLLRKAIQISQQTPYWHCRLLFQLAVCIVIASATV